MKGNPLIKIVICLLELVDDGIHSYPPNLFFHLFLRMNHTPLYICPLTYDFYMDQILEPYD